MSAIRLYRVTVTTDVLMLASSEAEAFGHAVDYAKQEHDWAVDVDLVETEAEIPTAWRQSLVYGSPREDLTAVDAFRRFNAGPSTGPEVDPSQLPLPGATR